MATLKENYVEVKAIVEREGRTDLVEFIDGRIAQLEKKSSSPKKPTERQKENVVLKAEILDYLMQVAEPLCIKDIQAGIESLAKLTNQRISHLLTDLVKAGEVEKTYVKKVPYYSIKM